MLKKTTKYDSLIGLMPMTSIQFLDFDLKKNTLPRNIQIYSGSMADSVNDAGDAAGLSFSEVLYSEERECFYDSGSDEEVDGDELTIRFDEIYECFAEQWLPLPFFKLTSRKQFKFFGPTNWVRCKIVKLDSAAKNESQYRLILAVDTHIFPLVGDESEPSKYTAPTTRDIETASSANNPTQFSLCSNDEKLFEFINEPWMRDWIDACYEKYYQRVHESKRLPIDELSDPKYRKVRGRLTYLALIKYLVTPQSSSAAGTKQLIPDLFFVQAVTGGLKTTTIDIDLVLDIGHSRTCGFLLDNINSNSTFDGSKLELRDFSQPQYAHRHVFDSRLEFSNAYFGSSLLSKRSGRHRHPAFVWPSICRIGVEAKRLSYKTKNNFGVSGFINPKRFLWDSDQSQYAWHFSTDGRAPAKKILNAEFCSHLDDNGDLIKDLETLSDCSSQYPRSAMMTFFLSEIFAQVISQINSIDYRSSRHHTNIHRVLKNVILTVPSAISADEIALLESRAKDAIDIIWTLLGWKDESHPSVTKFLAQPPTVSVNWDEPTCTQATFLYAEVVEKFHSRAGDMFTLLGKKRQQENHEEPKQSLRIASLDIGGGTTDLAITTYFLNDFNAPLSTKFNIREGFELGGSEILKHVIEQIIIPGLICALELKGMQKVEPEVRKLFTTGQIDQTNQDRQGQRALALQVLQELAIHALKLHEETANSPRQQEMVMLKLGDILSESKSPSALAVEYFTDKLFAGEHEIDLMSLCLPVELTSLEQVIYNSLIADMSQLCELIHKYNADVLLVSGGVSRLPALQRLISNHVPVSVNRINFMHQYYAGEWYPYKDENGFITSPKTSVVIGAAILHLARGNLKGFSLNVEDFRYGSMIQYIGFMDEMDSIEENSMMFNKAELESDSFPVIKEFPFSKRSLIGFQQFNLKRWPVTPFYSMSYKNQEIGEKYPEGVKVELILDKKNKRKAGRYSEDEADMVPAGYVLEVGNIESLGAEKKKINKAAIALKPCSITSRNEWQETGAFEVQKSQSLLFRCQELKEFSENE